MITTDTITRSFPAPQARSLCCPVCLHDLRADGQETCARLACTACASAYVVVDGLPVLLVEDENWRRKEDEITGETAFNTETVPFGVHIERNAFVDGNTAELLRDAELDLGAASVLVVGCSMAELDFFGARARTLACLDIVPRLALAALRSTRRRGLAPSWVCGDGEALPFEDGTFDAVVVRQALHHMLDYGAAVTESFRVCRVGGYVVVIDEPFAPADPAAPPLSTRADHHPLYGDCSLGDLRRELGQPPRPDDAEGSDPGAFRARDGYVAPIDGDTESLLADKYSTLSLVGLLTAVQEQTDDVRVFFPSQVGWAEGAGSSLQFKHGPNPHLEAPLATRLVCGGNASVVARKTRPVSTPRDRTHLRAAPVETTAALAGA